MTQERDEELTRLSQAIDDAKVRRSEVRAQVRACKAAVDAVRDEIAAADAEISQMKTEASQEFEYASLCYDSEDHAHAKEHSVKAHALMARAKAAGTAKEPLYERLEQAKVAYGEALSAQDEAHAALDGAHAAFHERLEVVKEQRAHEWKQKECALCKTPIRYNVNWTHIPNICPECRERERAMWQEKPCRRCGATVRFRIDWKHPPNYCKDCKEEMAAQREASRGSQESQQQPAAPAAVGQPEAAPAALVVEQPETPIASAAPEPLAQKDAFADDQAAFVPASSSSQPAPPAPAAPSCVDVP